MNPLLIYKKPVTLTFFRGVSAAILFTYGILVARTMGPSGFGAYSYIMVLVFLGGTIADFGTDRVLLREIGRDLRSWRTNWIEAAVIRTGFGLVLLLLSGLVGGFLGFIAGLAILVGTLARSLETVLIASQRILPIGVSLATQNLAHAFFGLFLLNRGFGIIGLLEAFLLSQIIYLVLIRIFISDRLLSMDFNFGQIKLFLDKSWPYFIIALLALVYSRVDLILIKHWLGESSAGYYSAAYRFLDAVNIFPAALALTQTPLFARLGKEGAGGWEKYRSLLAGNMVLGTGVAIVLYLAAKPLIQLLYGPDFYPSIGLLRVLSLATFFIFIHSANVALAFSIDDSLGVAKWSFVTMMINLGLNLIFIPTMGIIGAAWATVIGAAASFVVFYRFLRPYMLRKIPVLGLSG